MFTKEQKNIIYKYFPQVSENGYKRCENCYINIVDKWKKYTSEYVHNCYICAKYYIFEDIVKTNLLVKSYVKYGLSALEELSGVLDPKKEIKNIHNKALLEVLDKPQKIKELLKLGADPDMDYGEITGRYNYTLLQWCLQENNEIATLLLTKASLNGKIFKNRNNYNRTPMGEQIYLMIKSETKDDYAKEMIKKLLELGADPNEENLNTLGISDLQYNDNSYRKSNIKWLIDLGVKYDLNKCIDFGCNKICRQKTLKETNLGKLIISF